MAFRKLRHSLSKTPLRAPLVWIRHRGVRRNDVFVASYPRSGSTWLRFMLLEILAGQAPDFSTTNKMLPDIGKQQSAAPVLAGYGRLIKTHELFRPKYRKAIYLVRDPRDVALSEFAYQRALGLAYADFDSYLYRFLQGRVNPFGSWIRHATSWLNAADAGRSDILYVNFEKLKDKPEEQLGRILDFLQLPELKERVRGAIANNSLAQMKEQEKLKPQRASAKGQFIRDGSVGGWRSTFSSRQAEIVQQCAGNLMARLGYPTVQCYEGSSPLRFAGAMGNS
jgi:hypothetical protein